MVKGSIADTPIGDIGRVATDAAVTLSQVEKFW